MAWGSHLRLTITGFPVAGPLGGLPVEREYDSEYADDSEYAGAAQWDGPVQCGGKALGESTSGHLQWSCTSPIPAEIGCQPSGCEARTSAGSPSSAPIEKMLVLCFQ